MFIRRGGLERAQAGETFARYFMIALRWFSIVALCLLFIGLIVNFGWQYFQAQFLPCILFLLGINLGVELLHWLFRSIRVAYEAEADERMRNFKPLIHKESDDP
jgi:hypothetical protein